MRVLVLGSGGNSLSLPELGGMVDAPEFAHDGLEIEI
jgi:hypothetical protein